LSRRLVYVMRIVNWNVRRSNLTITAGIRRALTQRPDILCLQEVPERLVRFISSLGYHTVRGMDFKPVHPSGKHTYTYILTSVRPVLHKTIPLLRSAVRVTALTRMLYRGIFRAEEQHNGVYMVARFNDTAVQILNTRLSCVVPPAQRIRELKALFSVLKKNMPVVVCGDFNVGDSAIFTALTGWLRGYSGADRRFDERSAAEKLFREYGLINIFRGISTVFSGFPVIQLDHILVPAGTAVSKTTVPLNTYGSDHRMLFADITL